MNAILQSLRALIVLSWRGALRNRACALLVITLPALIFLLPFSVSPNSSLSGERTAFLGYALYAAWAILYLVTLWLACSGIAQEIAARRYTLTVVKPVHPAVIFIGKWLGIVSIQAVLLGLIFISVLIARQTIPTLKENLTEGRYPVHPQLPPVAESARAFLAQAREQNLDLPDVYSDEQLLAEFVRREPNRYIRLEEGVPQSWSFYFPKPLTAGDELIFKLSTSGILGSRLALNVDYSFVPQGQPEKEIHGTLPEFRARGVRFRMPIEMWGDDVRTEHAELTLTRQPPSDSGTLLFRPRKDLTLMMTGISFENNLLRAVVIQLAVIAALAALGLTLSVFFSLPVAIFTALVSITLIQVSAGVVTSATLDDKHAGFGMRTGIFLSEMTQILARSNELSSTELLMQSEAISGESVARQTGWYLIVLPLIFGIPGVAVLRRKELPRS